MAHLRDCTRQCDWPCCSSGAREELRTWRNETFGYYCGRHATQKLKQVEKDEQKQFARQQATS